MKRFRYGFLVLALITLFSGMVQAKSIHDSKDDGIELSVNSPPAVLPANVFVYEINSLPACTWYCTLNPGYVFNASVAVSDGILFTDMLDMKCNTYYIIEKPVYELPTLTGYAKEILKYPHQIRGISNKFYATSDVNQSVPSWIYRSPRDGLRQSWQA